MKVTVCDKCGAIIPDTRNISKACLTVWYNPVGGGSIDIVSGDTHDFCPACLTGLIRSMTSDFPFMTTGHEYDKR